MSNPLDYISYPLGQFLNFIYNTLAFHSYGLAIIIFTLVIKAVLLPLSIKQYRSMSKMQELQPQIQEIQKRYKNDKEKLNQELLKVYQENKVNPAGGCGPLLLQMPILISLYWVISSPLRFMLMIAPDKVKALGQLLNIAVNAKTKTNITEIAIINSFNNINMSEVSKILSPDAINRIKDIGKGLVSFKIGAFPGFNLGMVPTWNFDMISKDMKYAPLLLIPILAAVTTYISLKFTSPANRNTDGQAQSMQNSMAFAMPLVTAFFTFSVPAGLGLYWIVSNVVQIFQQMYMNKYIIKKKEDVNK